MKVPQRSKYAALHTITMWDGVGGPGVVVDGVEGSGVGLDGVILGSLIWRRWTRIYKDNIT